MEPDEAKDVVSETFLIAWRRLSEIPSDPLPWLLGVARRVITTRRRAHKRRAHLHWRLRAAPLPPHSFLPSEERLQMANAFKSLSPKDREVLILIGWDGLTIAEAAHVLGCTQQSFSVRLHRARRRLQAGLEADERSSFRSRRTIPSAEETG